MTLQPDDRTRVGNDAPVDYDWLASQFVLDELDDEAEAQCAALLQCDPAFAEAVGRAAELMDAVRHGQFAAVAAREPARSWRPIAAGVGIGVAACAVLGLTIWAAGLLHIGSHSVVIAAANTEPEAPEDPGVATEWFEGQLDEPADLLLTEGFATVAAESDALEEDLEQIAPWRVAIANLPVFEDDPSESGNGATEGDDS